MGLRVFDFFKPSCHFFSVDVEHCEIGQVQYPQIMSLVSWKYLNVYGSWDSTSPPLHSFFSRQLVSTRYLLGLDGMVGLDYVSDQKHLTAVNSMTVVSMIYFCDITKAVKPF